MTTVETVRAALTPRPFPFDTSAGRVWLRPWALREWVTFARMLAGRATPHELAVWGLARTVCEESGALAFGSTADVEGCPHAAVAPLADRVGAMVSETVPAVRVAPAPGAPRGLSAVEVLGVRIHLRRLREHDRQAGRRWRAQNADRPAPVFSGWLAARGITDERGGRVFASEREVMDLHGAAVQTIGNAVWELAGV